jgi:hypothetical protein
MRIDRRDFLGFAATGPLIFGLCDLFAQDQDQDAPPWWKSALQRMKETGRPGLVFIAPESSDRRTELGWAIRDLLESGDSRAQEVFCASVVVCLRSEMAAACLPGDAAPNRMVVLDPAGKVVENAEITGDELKNPEAFEERMSKFLHGEGEARLALAAEQIRTRLTMGEKLALAGLSSELVEERDRNARELAKSAEALMPLLIFERRCSKNPERAGLLRQIIDARFGAADELSPGPRLPFGAKFTPFFGGCGAESGDGVSIQCGMARMEGKGQRFLEFLKK